MSETRSCISSTLRQTPGVRVKTRAWLTRFSRCSTTPAPTVCCTREAFNSSTRSLSLYYASMNNDWLDFGVSVASVGHMYGKHGSWRNTTGTTKTLHHAIEQLKSSCVGKRPKHYFDDEKTASNRNSATAKRIQKYLSYGEVDEKTFQLRIWWNKKMCLAKRDRRECCFPYGEKKVQQRETGLQEAAHCFQIYCAKRNV